MAKLGGKRQVGVSRDALRRQQEKQDREGAEGHKQVRKALNSDEDAPIKFYKEGARCVDGPRHDWQYYVEDLQQNVRAGEAMGRPFDYKPTGRKILLLGTGGMKGQEWKWTGPNSAPASRGR